jgi:excisionase family DNA binding protein
MIDIDHMVYSTIAMGQDMWISVAEAAENTGRPAVTIRRWAREGIIPAEKSGGVWLVRLRDCEALIQDGVPSGRIGILSNDPLATLTQAWRRVAVEVERDDLPDIIDYVDFGADAAAQIRSLAVELENGYQPRPFRIVEMPKNLIRSRPLAQLSVEDRLLYESCVQSLARSIDSRLYEHVYNHRLLDKPDGTRLVRYFGSAFAHFQSYIKGDAWIANNATYCLVADIASFYEYVDHNTLIDCQEVTQENRSTLTLLKRLLEAWREQSIVIGLPQGPSTASGILCNSYLASVDSVASGGALAYARFSDDMRLFFASEAEARRFAPRLVKALREVGLNLSGVKTEFKTIPDLIADVRGDRRTAAQYSVDTGKPQSISHLRAIFDAATQDPINVDGTDFRFSLWRLGLLEDTYPLVRLLSILPFVPFAANIVADYFARVGYTPEIKEAVVAYLLSSDNVHEWTELHLLRLVGRFDDVPAQLLNRLRYLAESTTGVSGDFAARTLGEVGEPQDALRLRRMAMNRSLEASRRRACLLGAARLSEQTKSWAGRLEDGHEPPEVVRAARFVVREHPIPATLVLRRVPPWVAPLRKMLEEEGTLPPRVGT